MGLFVVSLILSSCQNLLPSGTYGEREQDNPVKSIGFSGFQDVPVPHNARMDLDTTLVFGSGDSWTGRLVKYVGLGANETYDFYLNQMPNYGWTKVTTIRSDISVLTYVRGDRIATITVQPRSITGSKVEFTVSPREYGNPQSNYRK